MALEEGRFFRGAMTDKRFEADGMAAVFRRFLPSGVWELGSNLQVTAGGGMTVAVGYGYGLVDGYPYGLIDNSTGALQLELEVADALPRIDRVVVKADTISLRVYAYIKRGTSAEAPEVPALDSNEISLARIAVAAGASEILAADITDDRTVILPMNGYLPLTGGPMTGNITMENSSRLMQKLLDGTPLALISRTNADDLVVGHYNSTAQGSVFLAAGSSGRAFLRIGNTATNEMWHMGNMTVENGSWTPTFRGDGTAGSFTYASRSGFYYRIGRLVYVYLKISITAVNTAPTGNYEISDLPFTPAWWHEALMMIRVSGSAHTNFASVFAGAGNPTLNAFALRYLNSSAQRSDMSSTNSPITTGSKTIYIETAGVYYTEE